MTSTLTAPVFGTREVGSLTTGLPLTPFEEYMVLDDTDDYPMSFHNWCRLVGPLDREALDAALVDVQVRHPLLSARAECQRGKWRWVPSGQEPAIVDWADDGQEPRLLPRLDLTNRAGLHACGTARGEVSDICLQMHHACCDGIGSVQFMRDWLLAYAARTEGKPPNAYWQPLDLRRLPQRSTPRLPWFRWPGFLVWQSVGLLGVRDFLGRKPVPLVPASEHVSGPAAPAFLSRSLEPSTLAALLERARAAKVTLFEWILRELMLVLHAWRQERNYAQPADWLRIATPINLRGKEDQLLPAANVMSSAFLDSQLVDCANPDALLRYLHGGMESIKRYSLGWTFVASLAVARLIPGHIERGLRAKRCHASAIYSNFGRVLDDWPLGKEQGRIVCGNVSVEKFDFVAILRHQTNLCLVTHTYADRLRITAPYDRRVLSEADVSAILDALVERLQASARPQEAAA